VFSAITHRVADHAAHAPQAEAICTTDRRVAYGELWAEIGAVATFLKANGLSRGDRVAVLIENSPDYVAAYYGALAAGGVAVGLNHGARSRELVPWLRHCGAKWLFADGRHPDLQAAADAVPDCVIVTRRADRAGQVAWPAPASDAITPVDVAGSDPAAIIYTSGTTGRPKGVTLTHLNLASNAASIIEYLRLDRRDRVLTLLPFFYSYGNSVLHTHLTVGATLVLENSLAFPVRVLERMAAERVTGFPGVPSTFALLTQAVDLAKFDLKTLRYVTQAGGAMPPSQISRFKAALPKVDFIVMYGQTEATARLTYLPPARLEDKLGSVGVPIPGVELSIRDEDGRELPVGELGEVCAQGANVMAGYFRDPEATAGVLRGGWLHTGDIGRRDADGFLFLEGRRSDMIKSGAHRISPLDIEEVVAALPEVAEVAVVGVPDDVLGESIKAVVRLKPGARLTASDVQRHCTQQLPRYKVPKAVEFASDLPRTATGKVMRYQLR
jgi:long-chain acyl-CoA synthetase